MRPTLDLTFVRLAGLCLLCVFCALSRFASAGTDQTPSRTSLRVVTSIAPLKGLVEPLLKESGMLERGSTIDMLIPPGISEHGYEIPPSKLVGLAKADVVVLVGMGLEPQVESTLKARGNSRQRVIVAADVLGMKPDESTHTHDHDHANGDHSNCTHGSIDPHVWLDPAHARALVSNVAEQLRDAVGDDAHACKRLWLAEEAQLKRIDEIDRLYARVTAAAQTRVLVVGHDAWGHLAKRYNFQTVPIKGLNATEPTPESMSRASKAIREQGARAVCVEPQLSPAAGKRLAESSGVEVLTLDPLGKGDWFEMMRSNLRTIARAMGVAESVYADGTSDTPSKPE